MSTKTGLRGLWKKASAVVAAAVTATSLMVAGSGTAAAANRDVLGPGCVWDAVGFWVQRCTVDSPATGHPIQVQIQPAKNGGNAGLYLLDGLRATDATNAWVNDSDAQSLFVDNNITLVMPIGGAASFYADWEGPATYDFNNPVNYKWETFLTQELPAYLEQNFGVARNNNAIAGLSMGGTAAMNLGAKHPDQFRQVLSYSGYLATTLPGMQTMMRVALLDAGGFNINAMYGSMLNPRRFQNDPMLNLGGLRNSDVFVSAASGVPHPDEWSLPPNMLIAGSPLEAFSLYTTRVWTLSAQAQGVKYAEDFPAYGLHNWRNFTGELHATKPRILDVMNAW
ncbi:esterase family protein [Corynebacterium poyangense]|uniref:Esterase family protein n=1 Tax=Corynebacterium poyangense TaxID=2684405 RepID=A0A7H0SRN6_9CORY|nr:alpha/beta hydrolase family protein [Corynebacterium poyangense]MBZ8176644.1 esterase family protein [Corynebacterium poyangense]QNQ91211.1 esterase family protein [Corynebacterium poyangense]